MEENKQMEKEVGKGDGKGSSENFLLEVYLKELTTKFPKIQTVETTTKLSETQKCWQIFLQLNFKGCCFAKLSSLLRRAICIFITPRSVTTFEINMLLSYRG